MLHIVIEGHHAHRRRERTPCTAPPLPSGRTPDGQVAARPAGVVLLAVPQAADGRRRRRLVARPGRRLRRPVASSTGIAMYYEGTQLYRPNERPFALHRNASAGVQRFGGFIWSGDIQSRWETLKTHVPVAINTGLSGLAVLGHGHRRILSDGRLHRRTVRPLVPVRRVLSALPLARAQLASAPAVGLGRRRRRPAARVNNYTADPAEMHNTQVEPICRKYLELRYRLMPYLYTAVRECTRHGLPIMRALWLHDPDGRGGRRARRSVPVGRGHARRAGRREGRDDRASSICRADTGIDFWTNERVDGGREIDRAVDLATTPLYVRAGAVIPMGPVKPVHGRAERRTAHAGRVSRRRRRRRTGTRTTAACRGVDARPVHLARRHAGRSPRCSRQGRRCGRRHRADSTSASPARPS